MECVPVPAATTECVLEAIRTKIIYRHSLPKEFIVDRVRQFISNLLKVTKEKEKFKVNFTAPYHPMTNGMTERANQTLKRTIAKFASSDQTDWDECLAAATFSYNATKQESTEYSPFYLVDGREPRLPIDLELPVNSEMEIQEAFPTQLIAARSTAKRNSRKAHEKSKVRFDKNKRDISFKIGDRVLRCMPVRKKRLT